MGRLTRSVVVALLTVVAGGGSAVLAACEGVCSAAAESHGAAAPHRTVDAAPAHGHAHHPGTEAEEQPAADAGARIDALTASTCCGSFGPPLPIFTTARPDAARSAPADAPVLAAFVARGLASSIVEERRPPPGRSVTLRAPAVLRI